MPKPNRLILCVLCLAVGTRSTPTASAARMPGVPVLPSLRLAFESEDVDFSPPNTRTGVRVSETGSTLYAAGLGSSELLLVVDSVGRKTGAYGRRGAGPGEMRDAEPVGISAASITAWDPTARRLTKWTPKGPALRMITSTTSARPIAVIGAGYLGVQRVGRRWRPVLLDSLSLGVREILSVSDTAYEAIPGWGSGPQKVAPIVGLWQGGVLLADPPSYKVALYDWSGAPGGTIGRSLKPERPSEGRIQEFLQALPNASQRPAAEIAQFRAQMAGMDLPLLAPGGMPSFDAKGRLWLLGYAADSAFADVFEGSRFLGRIGIPCKGYQGSFAVNTRWLVVVCKASRATFDGDAVLKLFRIVG